MRREAHVIAVRQISHTLILSDTLDLDDRRLCKRHCVLLEHFSELESGARILAGRDHDAAGALHPAKRAEILWRPNRLL